MLIGLVGKPSTGKSTFFRAATLAEAEIAAYPFTTIKPNTGVGYVKVQCVDREFNVQCNPRDGFCINGWRFVPTQVLDVAGLIPGAHEGLGLGNQFLDDLRQADIFIHIVDISGSTSEKGESVPVGSYDPANDVRFLEVELDLWYFDILKKAWDRFARHAEQIQEEIPKAVAKQMSGLGNISEDRIRTILENFNLSTKKLVTWTDDDIKKFAATIRKETKPMIIACNKIDVKGAYENYVRLKKEFPDYLFVPCSAESELALREAARQELIVYVPGEKKFVMKNETKLNDNQKKALAFIQQNILDKYGTTGVQDVLDKAVFELLKYIVIFPGGVNNLVDKHGNVLPDAFLLKEGSTPVDFAFRIHTDIGKNYIKAINVKTKLPLGKEHILKNRDVVEIKTSK
ncbi:redox-regulated ATPase YchF [Candidatus Woesearchaeota archaeon]|nr:redox-regulated ATPase YchF [Candidatus Woesearchaeota archaeon]